MTNPSRPIDAAALETLFLEGRTFNHFDDTPVPEATIRRLAELAELGPTESNALPGRFLFVASSEAKARLVPHMGGGNKDKTLKAPLNVIVAYDLDFPDVLPRTMPHTDAKSWYAGSKPEDLAYSAVRSASLQAAYLIMAIRALGLDAGPQGGFSARGIEAEFFTGQPTWRALMVINVGNGQRDRLRPRNPRLPFEEFARIL